MSYRIGSFNMLNFSGKTQKDLDVITNIIVSEQFDIIALQEVLRPEALTMLLRRLPLYWEGSQASPRSNKSELEFFNDGDNTNEQQISQNVRSTANTAKGYAFLWNTKRVRECSRNGPQIFEQIKNGALVRNPYYGRFTPAGLPGGSFFEIRLINVHLCSPAEDKAARMKEYALVTEEVYNRINKKRYGDNMPAYTILLGDYNMPIAWCSESGLNSTNQMMITEQEEKTTLKRNITDSQSEKVHFNFLKKHVKKAIHGGRLQSSADNDENFANDYDHFSYDMLNLVDIPLKIARINSVKKYYHNDLENHRKQISDHVPIVLELELNSGY
ncbi:hypothetical protein [Treponema primitia]|uniref:hypothetical protein n=1 Tax=Treponema primitia TaxID=88058 RepID=UPI000255587C|nr:hypothetical protein [Treponema primitia]